MKELLGGCLQAAGILITGLFGLCTVIMLASVNSWRSFVTAIEGIVWLIVPIAIGCALIVAGRALIRSARESDFD